MQERAAASAPIRTSAAATSTPAAAAAAATATKVQMLKRKKVSAPFANFAYLFWAQRIL